MSAALDAAVERIVSAFSAVLHVAEDGSPDFAAFQQLLRDPKHGLTPEERTAIDAASPATLNTAIEAEILSRRLIGCWPHAQLVRRSQA